MRILSPLAGTLLLVSPLTAQGVALAENFELGVPPPGWSQVQHNALAAGWRPSGDGRAWHQDESSAVGACDDELISPVLDLSGFTQVYAHFSCELRYADYLANHPGSSGDGETDLFVRVAGGSWTEAWTDTRLVASTDILTVDLSPYVAGQASVEFAFRYYGTFAHETWVDWVQVDDDPVAPPPPPPPPVNWVVNLPSSFRALSAGGTADEDFEPWAGVPPAYMALTSVVAATGQSDPDGWCSIAGATYPAAGGVRCLEMGIRPGSTNFHYARNALVLGLDGTGTTGLLALRFWAINFGEENQAFDGVWISVDGAAWYHMLTSWTGLPAAWAPTSLDLRSTRDLTDGPFYLMFSQEDNFPYATTDGIGVDSLELDMGGPPPPPPPSLTRTGPCPGIIQLDLDHLTPRGTVILLYGPAGSFTQNYPSQPCLGLTIDIRAPVIAGTLPINASGQAHTSFFAPVFGCGLTVQAVDLSTCTATNAVVL